MLCPSLGLGLIRGFIGTLTTYFRRMYPALTVGGLAASAPIGCVRASFRLILNHSGRKPEYLLLNTSLFLFNTISSYSTVYVDLLCVIESNHVPVRPLHNRARCFLLNTLLTPVMTDFAPVSFFRLQVLLEHGLGEPRHLAVHLDRHCAEGAAPGIIVDHFSQKFNLFPPFGGD